MTIRQLPIPPHFDPDRVARVWPVLYQERAKAAEAWAKEHNIQPTSQDRSPVCLMLIDVQNTFCTPGYELFVAGRTGRGAVEDSIRLCRFIYRNLEAITQICPTLDSHTGLQIFHSVFLINDQGEHPEPYTLVSLQDVEQGVWRFNPNLAATLGVTASYGQQTLLHYVRKLKESGKYDLTIWPYHSMIGGIGHALVAAVEEAVFFHSVARYSQPSFQIKGDNSFTENYSVLSPEVLEDASGRAIAQRNTQLIDNLLEFDAVIIAGQAKSHCVAWTIDDLLDELLIENKELVEKVYLLEDCTSPVVIPGVVDYTDQADEAFKRFSDAGMHVVRSTDPIESWPDFGR
jgi:nicotinamidase-related amidase